MHLHQLNNGLCSWWPQISYVWVILVPPTFGFYKSLCSWSTIHFAIMLLEKEGEKLKCLDGNALTKSPQQVCSLHTPSTLRPHPWIGREAKLPEFLLADIRSGRNEDFGLVAVILMFWIFFLCFRLCFWFQKQLRETWDSLKVLICFFRTLLVSCWAEFLGLCSFWWSAVG